MESTNEPLMFGKAVALYRSLLEDASESFVDGMPCLLWRGHFQDAYKNTRPKISSAHYGRIMRGLYKTGSLSQLQRGARNTDTIMVLHHEPTVDEWIAYERSPLTERLDWAKLKTEIDNKEVESRDALQQIAAEVARQGEAIDHLANHLGIELP